MDKETIKIKSAPAPLGSYSQGVRLGNLIFLSGQLGIEPISASLVEGGISLEARQILENLSIILKELGLSFGNVVKSTVFLRDLNDFRAFDKVYKSYFEEGNYPARTTVGVSDLPAGALVGIDFIICSR